MAAPYQQTGVDSTQKTYVVTAVAFQSLQRDAALVSPSQRALLLVVPDQLGIEV